MPAKIAIYDVLNEDVDVKAAIGTYEFDGVTPEPAIFTSKMVPKDAPNISIHIAQVSGNFWGVRALRGAEQVFDVNVWGDQTHDDEQLRDAATKTWRALDRATLCMVSDGYEDWGTQADPPVVAEDPDGFNGYLIRVRTRILEVGG